MTLREIIRKAESETGGTVDNVVDCGDKWALSFAEFRNEHEESDDEIMQFLNSKTGSAHVLASKTNDEFKYCSAYDYIQSTKGGTNVSFVM